MEKQISLEKNPHSQSTCPNCQAKAKLRERGFSDLAWQALLNWNEISPQAVGQAICESCYEDLREVLIDRHEEVHRIALIQNNTALAG